jgi:hypothetical protein
MALSLYICSVCLIRKCCILSLLYCISIICCTHVQWLCRTTQFSLVSVGLCKYPIKKKTNITFVQRPHLAVSGHLVVTLRRHSWQQKYIYIQFVPGIAVMITIFCDFCLFSAKNFGVFLKNQCYDSFFAKISSSLSKKNTNFFAIFFG